MTDYPGHIVQIGEADRAIVRTIAKQLAANGYALSSPDGVFDDAYASVVKTFQAQNVDASTRPLHADGKVGPLTWGALFPPPAPPPATGLAGAALAIAKTQVGVMEVPPGSNAGPQVNSYLASVGLGPGYSWCMSFVHWCFDRAAADQGVADPFPRTGGCLDAWARVSAADPSKIVTAAAAQADPGLVRPGMVFVLDHGGGQGHTGFVSGQAGGALQTVEGNSNDNGSANGVGVFALNRRSVMEPDLKGFLDFTGT